MMAVNRTKDPVRGVFYPASILKAVSSLLLHRPMLGWDSALKSSDSQFAFGGRMHQGQVIIQNSKSTGKFSP